MEKLFKMILCVLAVASATLIGLYYGQYITTYR